MDKYSYPYLELWWDKSKVEELERYPQLPISDNRRKPLLKMKLKFNFSTNNLKSNIRFIGPFKKLLLQLNYNAWKVTETLK